jgi:hypothetical protein
MDPTNEDGYVVFVRADGKHEEAPDRAERPVSRCNTYEEAQKVKRAWHQRGRSCVIRFVGPTGGGD